LFRGQATRSLQAKIEADALKIAARLHAVLAAQLVVSFEGVEQLGNLNALLLRADECFSAYLVRSHFFEPPFQELLRLVGVGFSRAFAVLFASQVVRAPQERAPLALEDAPIASHDLPPFCFRYCCSARMTSSCASELSSMARCLTASHNERGTRIVVLTISS
jgi:hypothetical protein